MVLLERSRSNSRSNTKNSEKKGKLRYYLLLFYQSLLEWEEALYTKVNYNVWASIISNKNRLYCVSMVIFKMASRVPLSKY